MDQLYLGNKNKRIRKIVKKKLRDLNKCFYNQHFSKKQIQE